MNSRDYNVQALGLGTPAGRLAYDVTYGDFIRLLRSTDGYNYDSARIRDEITRDLVLRDAAQAFLTTLDRYRAFLVFLKTQEVKDTLIKRLFNCPPSGAIIQPDWGRTYQCRRIVCPWCRHRQVLKLAQDPWAPLAAEVFTHRRLYHARNFRELNEVRKQATGDRHLFLRNNDLPFIRFQRVGLEMKKGKCFYRLLQVLVFRETVREREGWERGDGPYARVLELGFRYSAANLVSDKDWDLFGELLNLSKFRTIERSR